ncbi:unnamed protein product [Caenorhabditis brenneri]
MEDTTNYHQFDPSDLPPIIPMEDGPPKYDPDPSLLEIVSERGFKTDSEMIRRHREQNRPFRSVSPMDFTSNPLCNNQEFARSGQIEPGNIYDVKLHLVQFSSHPTNDNSVRKGSSPRSVKDPDDYVLMNQDSGDSRRNSCISSGSLSAIELNYQVLQPPQGPTETPPIAQRQGSGTHGQAAQKYDSSAHRQANDPDTQDHDVEGYDPPGHEQAEPKLDQHPGTHTNHQYAQYSTQLPPGLTIDASKLNRSDNASAMHYNGKEYDRDMSSGPYVAHQGQLELDPQHDAHGATHVKDQRKNVEEAGSNPVGQDQWGQSVGSRRHLATLDGRNPLELPIRPDLGSGQLAGSRRHLPTHGDQDARGQPTGQDFVSAGYRARPYKKGSRSKKPKLEVHNLSEMPVKQYLKLKNAHTHHLPAQQAHRPPDQFQYSPESELWTQPLLQQGDEQHAPHWDQIPYKEELWDPQHAGQQELLYQFQLELDHDLEQWTQPRQQQLPQGDEQYALHRDQVPYMEDLWDSQHAKQQAPYHLQLQADQDQILHKPESCDQPNPQYIPPSTGNGYTVPVNHSSHNFPIPQRINYAAAGRTSESYHCPDGSGVPPDHISLTAQPLEEGFADISNSPELDFYDLDNWKQDAPVQNDQCRTPANIIPQPWSQRTSISEYTNDTTSSSAQSSPSFPQRSSMDEAFLQAQVAILSDGLDEMEDLHDATIGTYADFARSIDLQLPVHVPCVPAARDSSPSESSFDGYSPPPSRISPKARRNRENPRLKRTAEQKRDRKREQNRKDSKKSVARKQSRREEAEKQSEYIKNSVKKQKGANLEFERNMEDLLAGHNSYLLHEMQEYIDCKEEVRRILDDQKEKDVKEAFEKKQAAKEKFEVYATEYKTIRDKSRKSTVGSQKCRASQDAQLLESEYQILLYSHDLRREKQLKALAELFFTRTIPFYMQQCQPINDIRLQQFIQDNQYLLQN